MRSWHSAMSRSLQIHEGVMRCGRLGKKTKPARAMGSEMMKLVMKSQRQLKEGGQRARGQRLGGRSGTCGKVDAPREPVNAV